MKNVMVTGGNGFIGRALTEKLLEKGCRVCSVSRSSVGLFRENDRFEEIIDDLKNIDEMSSRLREREIDTLFHFAWDGTSGGKTADAEIQLENVHLVCRMVELAKRIGVRRIVYAGSIMEYDSICNIMMKDMVLGQSGLYGIAKLTGHLMAAVLAKSCGVEFLPIIISNIYGEGEQTSRFLNSLLRKMQTDPKILLTEGTQTYDFIYMSDAVEMIFLVGESGRSFKKYYIGNQKQHPLREYVERIRDVVGYKGELCFGAIPMTTKQLTFEEFDTESFYQDFGFRPCISFEDGIRRVWEYYGRQRMT